VIFTFLAAFALGFLVSVAPSREETTLCTAITSLPATINTQGIYCLTGNLATNLGAGYAIEITVNNVTIDLNGFKLGNLAAGPGTGANGIRANQKKNITIRNGTIRGFFRGIWFDDDSPFTASSGHLIEDIRADGNTFVGIWVDGTGNIVRNNHVVFTGGSSINGSAYGIVMHGPGARVINNDVIGTAGSSFNDSFGIFVAAGDGSIVEGNRISDVSSEVSTSYGIWVQASSNVTVADNRIATADNGIVYSSSTGRYRDNITGAIATQQTSFVIHISVDGLRPDAIRALGPAQLPNLYRLRNEGVFTDNARTDVDFTITLPNHTTELTGRGVSGSAGHNYTSNDFPPPDRTIHSNKGSYVAGVFDVVHDNGLSTALYASKAKFILFNQSYDATNGAPDLTGADDGQDKIDVYVQTADTALLVTDFLTTLGVSPFNYTLLHLRDPDSAGHASDWMSAEYLNSVRNIDTLLGDILNVIENDPALDGNTVIILTSDHGGTEGTFGHSDQTLPTNYTIPFYVWGGAIAGGAELYDVNSCNRLDPGTEQVAYTGELQPVRNGDAANLTLDLLGLGPVSGSTINSGQDLALDLVDNPCQTDKALNVMDFGSPWGI
jgi:hypothetical protein